MSDKGIREFCQIALAREFTTPERVKEVISDCVRAQKAGKEVPVGEIFMRKEYLDRKQVVEIMKELYGERSIAEGAGIEEDSEDPEPIQARPVTPPVSEPSAPAPAPAAAGPPRTGRLAESRPRPDIARWIAVAATFPISFLAVFLALVLSRAVSPDPVPPLPSRAIGVVLATDLEGRLRIDRTEWADADGRGRAVLLVHYEVAAMQLPALPPRVRITALHDRAILEAVDAPIGIHVESIRGLTDQVGQERLFAEVLREKPSGILVAPFQHPALVDRILITVP